MVVFGVAGGHGTAKADEQLGADRWTSGADFKGLPVGAHTATLMESGDVLLTGGEIAARGAMVFSPVSGRWKSLSSMAEGRWRHIATRLADGRLLVVGGLGQQVLSSAETYDPASDRWAPTGSLAVGRHSQTATLLKDGRVLVAGGMAGGGHDPLERSAELYDPASGTWSQAAPMENGRSEHTATLLDDGKVLLAGGRGAGHGSSLKDAVVYSPDENKWNVVPQILGAERGLHDAAKLPGGEVMLIGGTKIFTGMRAENLLKSTEIYRPATNSFAAGPPLREGRIYHSAVELGKGRILVVGGYGRPDAATVAAEQKIGRPILASTPLRTAELYLAKENVWVPAGRVPASLGSSNSPRRISATLMDGKPCGDNCGKVLAVGGEDRGRWFLYAPPDQIDLQQPAKGGRSKGVAAAVVGGLAGLFAGVAIVVRRRKPSK